MTTTTANCFAIADCLEPAELAALEQAFRLEVAELQQPQAADFADYETLMGFVTGEYLWYSAWLFGIIVDDDQLESLGQYYRPEGTIHQGYYVPSDFDTEVSIIDLDHPPTEDAAWDARPL